MAARIVQFGTSRFLQAHVDLFVHEAREAGQDVGPITVVKTTRSAERAGRIAAFAAGYPVIVRGIEDGQPVERRTIVTSVDSGLSAAGDWDALVAVFLRAGFVVSNTGDTGYAIDPADAHAGLLDAAGAPHSFPAILLKLLWLRWRDAAVPITILPCELIHRNGSALHTIVAGLAHDLGAAEAFLTWLDQGVVWADTLVDRIVSAPIDPIGAVAEPYALWAIGARPGLAMPFTHPAIVVTDDLEPYERLKLHILNLGHTVLAQDWLDSGSAEGMTVRAMLASDAGARMEAVLRTEVLPGFAAKRLGAQAEAYVATTLDRFRNPYLDHLLSDIAQHHAQKIERRITAFFAWTGTETPQLAEIARRNAADHPRDTRLA